MFQDHEDNPILQPSKDDWDCKSAAFASVVPVDDWWCMFYSGKDYDKVRGWKIGAAVSRDGVKWFKHGTPVLEGTRYLWDQNSVHAPVAWRKDGKYRMLYTGIASDTAKHFIGCAESTNGASWSKRYTPCFRDYRIHDAEAWTLLPREDDYVLLYNTLIQPPRQVYIASTEDFEKWKIASVPLIPTSGEPDELGYHVYCANMIQYDGWYYIAAATSNKTYTKNAIGLWRTKSLGVDPEHLGEIIHRDQPWKTGEVDTPWIVPMDGNWVRIYYSGRTDAREWKVGLAEGTFE